VIPGLRSRPGRRRKFVEEKVNGVAEGIPTIVEAEGF
jgi:hypothetical protein